MKQVSVKTKAKVLDSIVDYLSMMSHSSQHHKDEFDTIQWMLNNPNKTVFQSGIYITPLEGDLE
jgi:hypothetical protein